MEETLSKERLFRKHLIHKHIQEIRGKGLMLAIIMKDSDITNYLILNAMKNGLLLFWLLYEPKAVRITPPLTISEKEILSGCRIILNILDTYPKK